MTSQVDIWDFINKVTLFFIDFNFSFSLNFFDIELFYAIFNKPLAWNLVFVLVFMLVFTHNEGFCVPNLIQMMTKVIFPLFFLYFWLVLMIRIIFSSFGEIFDFIA